MRFSLSMKDAVRRVATSSMSHRSEKSAKWAGSRENSQENSREYSSLSMCNCSDSFHDLGKNNLAGMASTARWRVGNNVGVESGGVGAVFVDRPVMLLLPLFPAHEELPERSFMLSFPRSGARIPHL